MRWEPSGKRGPLASLAITPARVTVGIGALAAVIAGFMPWAEGTAPGRTGFEPVFFSGLGGAGDGVMLVLLAGATGFLTLHVTPATSRVRLVHVLPYILIVLASMTVINGYRAALLEIAAWERRGGQGSLALGLCLAVAGVALMAAGSLVLLPGVVRWREQSTDPSDLMHVSGRSVAEAIGGCVGVLVGGAIGIQVAVSMTTIPVIGLIALGAVFGGLAGAYGGAWVARSTWDAIARRRSTRGA